MHSLEPLNAAKGKPSEESLGEKDEAIDCEQQNSRSLSTSDPDFDRKMEIFRRIKKRYHNAYTELAK